MSVFRTEGELRKGRLGLFLFVLSVAFLFVVDVMVPIRHGFPETYGEVVRYRAGCALMVLSVAVLWPLSVYLGVASIVEPIFKRRSSTSTV